MMMIERMFDVDDDHESLIMMLSVKMTMIMMIRERFGQPSDVS